MFERELKFSQLINPLASFHWLLSPVQFTGVTMTIVPNRCHNSGKRLKVRLKPQAKRSRKAALKSLKRKLGV